MKGRFLRRHWSDRVIELGVMKNLEVEEDGFTGCVNHSRLGRFLGDV